MVEQVNTDEILNQIITDRRYISAIDGDGETVDLMVRGLTPIEKTRADYIYRKAMSKARRNKLLTEKQCMADAISRGWWTKDKEKLIRLRNAEIDRIQKEQERHKGNKGKQIKYRTDMIIAKKALNMLLEEQARLSFHSAESYANTERANYILSCIILLISGIQKWKTYGCFLKENDSVFLSSLVVKYNDIKSLTEKKIREVARNSSWSIMWNASKKGGDTLFNKPTTEYSIEQILLCYWSIMYDSVYDSIDRPSDKIINNDEALDKWFDDQKDKSKAERSKSRTNDVFKGHKGGAATQQEEFVMVTSSEEADDVYDMNDKWSLAQIRSETKKIEDSDGYVDEYTLRRNKIKKQLMLSNSDKIAEVRRGQARGGGFLG